MAAEPFTSALTITPVPIAVALPVDVTSPVRLALVVTVAALPVQLAELPVVLWFNVGNVQFVSVPLAGVPSAGVVSVGLVRVLLVRVSVDEAVILVSN